MTICEKQYTVNMVENVCEEALIPQFTINGFNARMLQPILVSRLSNVATLTFAEPHGWVAGNKIMATRFTGALTGYRTPAVLGDRTAVAITTPSTTKVSYANAGADEGDTAVPIDGLFNLVTQAYDGVVNTTPTVVDTSISLASPIVSWLWVLTRVRYTNGTATETLAYTTNLSGQSPVWPVLFPAFMGAGTYFKIALCVTTEAGMMCCAQQLIPQCVLAGKTYPATVVSDAPDLGVFTLAGTTSYSATFITGAPYITNGNLDPFPSGPGNGTNGPDSAFQWRLILTTITGDFPVYLKTGQAVEGTYGPANPAPGGWPDFVTIS
jgi:hypothetical protein